MTPRLSEPNSSKKEPRDSEEKKGIKWDKPEETTHKLNFDGSFFSDGSSSTGFVIRDRNANVIALKGEKIQNCSVIGAEASAVRKGIAEALKQNIQSLTVEGDNLCIINALKGIWKCPWEVEMLISDARADLLKFRTVQICHVFRETNRIVDRLTLIGHITTTDNTNTDIELQVLIRKDALGWTTDRL